MSSAVDANDIIADMLLIYRGTILIPNFAFSIVTKCSESFYKIWLIIVVMSVWTMNQTNGAYFNL